MNFANFGNFFLFALLFINFLPRSSGSETLGEPQNAKGDTSGEPLGAEETEGKKSFGKSDQKPPLYFSDGLEMLMELGNGTDSLLKSIESQYKDKNFPEEEKQKYLKLLNGASRFEIESRKSKDDMIYIKNSISEEILSSYIHTRYFYPRDLSFCVRNLSVKEEIGKKKFEEERTQYFMDIHRSSGLMKKLFLNLVRSPSLLFSYNEFFRLYLDIQIINLLKTNMNDELLSLLFGEDVTVGDQGIFYQSSLSEALTNLSVFKWETLGVVFKERKIPPKEELDPVLKELDPIFIKRAQDVIDCITKGTPLPLSSDSKAQEPQNSIQTGDRKSEKEPLGIEKRDSENAPQKTGQEKKTHTSGEQTEPEKIANHEAEQANKDSSKIEGDEESDQKLPQKFSADLETLLKLDDENGSLYKETEKNFSMTGLPVEERANYLKILNLYSRFKFEYLDTEDPKEYEKSFIAIGIFGPYVEKRYGLVKNLCDIFETRFKGISQMGKYHFGENLTKYFNEVLTAEITKPLVNQYISHSLKIFFISYLDYWIFKLLNESGNTLLSEFLDKVILSERPVFDENTLSVTLANRVAVAMSNSTKCFKEADMGTRFIKALEPVFKERAEQILAWIIKGTDLSDVVPLPQTKLDEIIEEIGRNSLVAEKEVAERKEADKLEADRQEADRLEAEKKESDRQVAERKEADKLEADRKEADKLEADKLEAEKKNADKLEADRQEADRLEAEKKESDRQVAERKEADKLEADRQEADRLVAEKKNADKLEADRQEADRLEAEKKESDRQVAERKEADKLEADRQEADRLVAERNEADKLEVDRKEADRLEAEKKEADRLVAERKEADKLEADRQEADRLVAEKKNADKLEADRQEAERKDTERLEVEKYQERQKETKIQHEISETDTKPPEDFMDDRNKKVVVAVLLIVFFLISVVAVSYYFLVHRRKILGSSLETN
jgi:hypothetical protein